MSKDSDVSLTRMVRLLDLRVSARLLALMVASALTEGLGLVLLVPMLAALNGSGGSSGGRIAAWLTNLGVPLSLGPLLTIFAVLVILRALINHGRNLASVNFQVQLVDGLRARAWDALVHCDWRVFSTMRQSNSASLLINNIDRIGEALNQCLTFVALMVTLIAVLAAALTIAPVIALIAMAAGTIVLVSYRHMRRRAHQIGRELGSAYGAIQSHINEGLGAMRVVKSLGLEGDVSAGGIASFDGLRRAQIAYIRDLGHGQIALHGAGAIVLAVGVWYAVTRAHADMAQILPLVALFARGLPLLGGIQEAWQNWVHNAAAIGDTFALIAKAESAREPDAAHVTPPVLARDMTFEAITVRFAQSTKPALEAASFTLPAGSTLAVIGPSGAGKSTVADLAGGLLSPDSGRVLIDGVPLEGAVQRAWRSRVAYVQQEAVLFAGSIRDNLARAHPQADEAQLRAALAQASAQFVDDLPQGIDTMIGDGGRRLSGGEQQRIALARALLRAPALLILDEATSALDSANEQSVCEAIARLKGSLTIIIIGHRGGLVALADRVVTLAEGRISLPQSDV